MNHPVLFQVIRTAVGALLPGTDCGGVLTNLREFLFMRARGAVPEG